MQDRYVGDVGDFAKYAILRSLASDRHLQLGVVWYLFANESHNNDGKHVSYLRDEIFKDLDPDLHRKLKKLVDGDSRSVRAIARSKILPAGTAFYSRPIHVPGESSSGQKRAEKRANWLVGALAKTAACDLVFLDPDNGMETPSVSRRSSKAGKYVFFEEIQRFWQRGQSLVIYHHLNRTAPVLKQTALLEDRLEKLIPDAALIRPLTYRRGSCRHFWIIGQKCHADPLRLSLQKFLNSGWSIHFDR